MAGKVAAPSVKSSPIKKSAPKPKLGKVAKAGVGSGTPKNRNIKDSAKVTKEAGKDANGTKRSSELSEKLMEYIRDNPGLTTSNDTEIDYGTKPEKPEAKHADEFAGLGKPKPAASGDKAPTPEKAEVKETDAKPEAKPAARLLGKGLAGKDVKALQEKLNGMGAKLDLDGIFGPKTEAALKKFQEENNLKVDGLAGVNTNAKLKETAHANEFSGVKASEGAKAPAIKGNPNAKHADEFSGLNKRPAIKGNPNAKHADEFTGLHKRPAIKGNPNAPHAEEFGTFPKKLKLDLDKLIRPGGVWV